MLPITLCALRCVFVVYLQQLLTIHLMMMLRNVDDRDEDLKCKLYNFCMSSEAVL